MFTFKLTGTILFAIVDQVMAFVHVFVVAEDKAFVDFFAQVLFLVLLIKEGN